MSFIIQQDKFENKFRDVKNFIVSGKEKISPELRGDEWTDVPVPEHLQLDLAFNEIAYNYCSTGRYLYLDKIELKPNNTNFQREFGKSIDSALLEILKSSIKHMNENKTKDFDILNYLNAEKVLILEKIGKEIISKENFISIKQYKEILSISDKIISYEIANIVSGVSYQISSVPTIKNTTIQQMVMPLVIEPEISTSNMGFSNLMTPDFFYPNEKAIGDFKSFKYDKNDQAYKIAMAGYALAYEATKREEVDLGFILHLDSTDKKSSPIYHLDVFVISDNLRRLFIQKRNKLLNLISAGLQGMVERPKLPPVCPRSCPYLEVCKPEKIDETK